MENYPLWRYVIENLKQKTPYNLGVSVPYMVGVYYKKGLIQNLESSECIRTILQEMVDTIQPNEEAAIFLCDSYTPNVPMIQMLKNRNLDDIKKIKTRKSYLTNQRGEPVIYLQLDYFPKPYDIDTLTAFFWRNYSAPIQRKTFSVKPSLTEQADGTHHEWGEIKEKW